jgi:hypothetical protein
MLKFFFTGSHDPVVLKTASSSVWEESCVCAPDGFGLEYKYFVTWGSLPAQPRWLSSLPCDIIQPGAHYAGATVDVQPEKEADHNLNKSTFIELANPNNFERKFPEAIQSRSSQNSLSLCA